MRYSFESLTVMRFLCDLHQTVLRGVEELQMDRFVGYLEPQKA